MSVTVSGPFLRCVRLAAGVLLTAYTLSLDGASLVNLTGDKHTIHIIEDGIFSNRSTKGTDDRERERISPASVNVYISTESCRSALLKGLFMSCQRGEIGNT